MNTTNFTFLSNDTKTVVEYRINNEGKRVFINNPYKLNS